MYGPVAEIVLAHHERIDGRGYPAGLPGEEIPEIAKIISVAEVYDTLTASDTYRTPDELIRGAARAAPRRRHAARRPLRRGAGAAAERRGRRVPARGRRGLRHRARHGAADQRGRREVVALRLSPDVARAQPLDRPPFSMSAARLARAPCALIASAVWCCVWRGAGAARESTTSTPRPRHQDDSQTASSRDRHDRHTSRRLRRVTGASRDVR